MALKLSFLIFLFFSNLATAMEMDHPQEYLRVSIPNAIEPNLIIKNSTGSLLQLSIRRLMINKEHNLLRDNRHDSLKPNESITLNTQVTRNVNGVAQTFNSFILPSIEIKEVKELSLTGKSKFHYLPNICQALDSHAGNYEIETENGKLSISKKYPLHYNHFHEESESNEDYYDFFIPKIELGKLVVTNSTELTFHFYLKRTMLSQLNNHKRMSADYENFGVLQPNETFSYKNYETKQFGDSFEQYDPFVHPYIELRKANDFVEEKGTAELNCVPDCALDVEFAGNYIIAFKDGKVLIEKKHSENNNT